jgi:PAS domain S-box-containing protein
MELEELLKVSERKSDILTNLLKEASAEYNQALKQLKVSEEKFRTIVDSVRACIITTEMDRTISMINKAGINMFGYQEDEIFSRSIDELFLDSQSRTAFLADVKSGLGDIWGAEELVAVTADNTVFPAQITLSGIKGAGGENIGSVGIIRDISKEREVRRMKEDLVGMITHDMVNPILSMQRAIQLIIEMSLGPLSTAQMEIMQLALATTHQLFDMTNNLLDIYRNESGKLLLNLSTIDLHQIIQEGISQLRFFAKDKKLTIAFEPTLSPLELNGDQIRLMRVCTNLLDNAIRFSPEGSTIQVTSSMVDRFSGLSNLTTIPSVFREKIRAGQPYILTCVTDQGPGIPEKDKEAIFNKFFTTRVTGETRRKGVGLGLAFCKLAIEIHQGQIWVNSSVETEATDLRQGCRICFLLPVDRP